MEGKVLTPPDAAAEPEASEEAQIPSVMTVVNRYLVGGSGVSAPGEDGSRQVVFQSATGQALVEFSLSQQLCEELSENLVRVDIEIIEQGDENAGSGE